MAPVQAPNSHRAEGRVNARDDGRTRQGGLSAPARGDAADGMSGRGTGRGGGGGRNRPRAVWGAVAVALVLAGSVGVALRLGGAGSGSEVPSADVVAFLSGDAGGFARVLEPRRLLFPDDEGDHPEFRTEWWYYTGNLAALPAAGKGGDQRRRFGFQLTFFRSALAADVEPSASNWGSGQVYLAHFAVTDVERGVLYAAERLARGDAGLAGARADPYRVWLETWSASTAGATSKPSAAAAGENTKETGRIGPDSGRGGHLGQVRLSAADGPVAIDLVLRTLKPPVLHGEGGFSQKGPEPGNASYYYSFTRLAARGTITVPEGAEEVAGTAWMDHEWSTSALSEEQTGWDWLSLQLDDGRELMVFQIRELGGGIAAESSGSLVEADGRVVRLERSDFDLEPEGEWVSPRTGGRYPASWRVAVPSAALDLQVKPLIPDQELNVSLQYWEGASAVEGTSAGRPVKGVGYVEMTGYAPASGFLGLPGKPAESGSGAGSGPR